MIMCAVKRQIQEKESLIIENFCKKFLFTVLDVVVC